MIGRRTGGFALIAGALLMVVAGATIWMVSNAGPPAVHVSRPALVTNDGGPSALVAAQNSPALAVDPADSQHIVIADRVDRPRFGCAVRYSTDGGANWGRSTLPLPAGLDTCYVPDVTFSGRSVFVVFLTLNTHPRDPLSGGNDPNGTWLSRSDDGARTFGVPIDLHGHDNLQPRIVSDPRDGRIYVVYLLGGPYQNETPLGLGPPPNPIMVMSSTDGGRTFSAPAQVNDPKRLRVAAPTPAVAPDGKLLVLYEDYGNDLNDYNNKAVPFSGTHTLVLATSSDRGATFHQDVVDAQQVRPHPFLIYLPPFPALAITPDGRTILAAWSDARAGAPDVLLRRSTDGGRSWTNPLKLNQRKMEPANYDLPALAATASRIEAIFLAVRGSSPRAHIEYSYSTNGGSTFTVPAQISGDFDAQVGVPSVRDLGHIDYGSRFALAPLGLSGQTLAAWSDATLGNRNTGRTDIFAAQVRP